MHAFLDTNILLDIVEQRLPFYAASQAVLDACDKHGSQISAAWHGLATVFYITARKRGEAYAFEMIRDLLSWANVATVGQDDALEALGYGIADYEDALQAAAAKASGADWLVTRDATGFLKSPGAAHPACGISTAGARVATLAGRHLPNQPQLTSFNTNRSEPMSHVSL